MTKYSCLKLASPTLSYHPRTFINILELIGTFFTKIGTSYFSRENYFSVGGPTSRSLPPLCHIDLKYSPIFWNLFGTNWNLVFRIWNLILFPGKLFFDWRGSPTLNSIILEPSPILWNLFGTNWNFIFEI